MIYSFDQLSFQILSIERYFHREGTFFSEKRPFSALSLRVSGTGEFDIEGRRLLSRPSEVLYIPAGVPYRVKYSVSESIVVHLLDCSYTVPENIECQSPALMEMKFRELLHMWQGSRSVNRAKSQIYAILDALRAERALASEDTALARCVTQMELRLSDSTLDIPTLAKDAFVSVSSLQRAFRTHFNTSPKQYLIERRLGHAMELLVRGDTTVAVVAREAGFADEKYFSRVFSAHYGNPPSHFLQKKYI